MSVVATFARSHSPALAAGGVKRLWSPINTGSKK
jgi:hypothetical protein